MAEAADSENEVVTAGLLVIGDEILSGRTKDKNIGYIAEYLTMIGIDLKEVRIVSDEEPEIVAALNALRGRYDYVFTTGGIGPTHDDITADAVAKAFGVSIDYDPRAVEILRVRMAQAALVGYDASGITEVPAPVSAQELWEFYVQNRTQANLKLLPIPVSKFTAQVQEKPTDDELRKLYDRYNSLEYDAARETPGFTLPPRIRVQWMSTSPVTEKPI